MFSLYANKVLLKVNQREAVTSGSVNVYNVQFSFSSAWNGLDKTAVFQAGSDIISVVLDDSNTCTIPWEVLENPSRTLYVGVYGTKGGDIVLPTIWESLGTIQKGVTLGTNMQPPTPDAYSQILSIAEKAQEIAQSVRDDADEGKFDGETGPEGPAGPEGPPGDGVPPINPDDEGKILGVQDGESKWVISGSGSGNVSSSDISNIVVMDKSDYEYLQTKNPTTLYLIRG